MVLLAAPASNAAVQQAGLEAAAAMAKSNNGRNALVEAGVKEAI